MDKLTRLYHFMGFINTQKVKCNYDKNLSDEIIVLSKEPLSSVEYDIHELEKMNDRETVVIFYNDDDDEYINSPFYCWNEAMEVIDKIELTPCNFGFPQFVMNGTTISIFVDDLEFTSLRQYDETKLETLDRVVHQFLNYYFDKVNKL